MEAEASRVSKAPGSQPRGVQPQSPLGIGTKASSPSESDGHQPSPAPSQHSGTRPSRAAAHLSPGCHGDIVSTAPMGKWRPGPSARVGDSGQTPALLTRPAPRAPGPLASLDHPGEPSPTPPTPRCRPSGSLADEEEAGSPCSLARWAQRPPHPAPPGGQHVSCAPSGWLTQETGERAGGEGTPRPVRPVLLGRVAGYRAAWGGTSWLGLLTGAGVC